MPRRTIDELMQVPPEEHDLDWLHLSLQWAVDLEFATIPTYLSGMWSIKDQSGPVYDLIDSVVLEEMLHLGLACNMLKAIGGSPQITAPTYPGPLPGGVRPGLEVFLGGLTPKSVEMYMEIEMPENPLAFAVQTFPTIGAFYDAIDAAFTALSPPLSAAGQVTSAVFVPDIDNPDGPSIREPLGVIATPDGVHNAIKTIKDQGEGTSQSPEAPEFGGELAHYYRFGEILYGKKLIKVGDGFDFAGDPVPFPDCHDVPQVPAGGYPGVPVVQEFDRRYALLIEQLQTAWSSGAGTLGQAVRTMGQLTGAAAAVVAEPLPGGGGNYGPDFVPANAAAGSTPPGTPGSTTTGAVSFARDIVPLFTSDDVEHMNDFGVSLDDFSFMSQPSNAQEVFNQVSTGGMPIDDSGSPVRTWSSERVALFKSWMDAGFPP